MHPRADTSILAEIGGRLKAIRLAHGLTQADVAASLGVDQSLWSKWERGQRAPDLLRLMEFARRAGISIEMICTGAPFRVHPDMHDKLRDLAKINSSFVLRPLESEPYFADGFHVKGLKRL